jgi:organic radical activating enzyme
MPNYQGKAPMPVKYWSFAGIMLTCWCSARCACCYLCCSPDRREEMTVDEALEVWRQLGEASPRGCRVHLTGGEPFGNWERLIEVCRQGARMGLGPLEKVETNGFWADDESVIRSRLRELDQAGMEMLGISADPYHQQFVPIERCRTLARVAAEVLGPQRVQVRWRDWLEEGCDTSDLSAPERKDLFARYALRGRERLCGRAAQRVACDLPQKPPEEFADKPCRNSLLRGRHVHVAPGGLVMPGTCAGILLGRIGPDYSASKLWQSLTQNLSSRPIVATLAESGPVGLLERAKALGFAPRPGYGGKCHLCWDIRRFLAGRGDVEPARVQVESGTASVGEELGPAWLYADAASRKE